MHVFIHFPSICTQTWYQSRCFQLALKGKIISAVSLTGALTADRIPDWMIDQLGSRLNQKEAVSTTLSKNLTLKHILTTYCIPEQFYPRGQRTRPVTMRLSLSASWDIVKGMCTSVTLCPSTTTTEMPLSKALVLQGRSRVWMCVNVKQGRAMLVKCIWLVELLWKNKHP